MSVDIDSSMRRRMSRFVGRVSPVWLEEKDFIVSKRV